MSAKLRFKKVRAKNFRSFGNQFIEIDLECPNTLVVSNDNGAGKSTGLTHALTYVLFDKSYQKGQKKTSLVNSKNGKDSLVEVEFETKGSEFLVRRGQKPAIFEVIKDGVPIENTAARGDLQAYLEDIIGMDDKVFHNVVVLGRDKFVPFNEMSASDTRNFAETMLDQGIFSTMNELTKDDIKANGRALTDIGYEIGKTESAISSSERVIGVLQGAVASKQADNAGLVLAAREELAELQRKIDRAVTVITDLQAKASEQTEVIAAYPTDIEEKTQKMGNMLLLLNGRKTGLVTNRDRFLSMTTCPTCEQDVSEARKDQVKDKLNPEIEALESGADKLTGQYQPALQKRDEYREHVSHLQSINSNIAVANNGIVGLRSQIAPIERRIQSLTAVGDTSEEVAKIAEEQGTLDALREKLKEQQAKEIELLKEKTNLNVFLGFLKDDAAKGEIAKIYLPVLNAKVNEYLDALNLWVRIDIDSEFAMTMHAPERKGQTIADLSTGQMRRIDLAMLMAWRDVAQAKSSVDTNLLIMDETLENLSAQGVADFVDFFNAKYQTGLNLFVISQRAAEFSEYFDRVLMFSLKDDFSIMEQQ